MPHWDDLNQDIAACQKCPRLLKHCRVVALTKRAAYRDWDYWGKPVPNFGTSAARLLILGLAPGAHGANRTGRMFTGDRSGDFLYRALHATGFANQPTSESRDDGLKLIDAAMTAAAHCAPPGNKPTPREMARCFPWLIQTVQAMPNLRGIVALGRIAFDAALRIYPEMGWSVPKPRPAFAHGATHRFPGAPFLLCSYHPSQQNTFTGRLTPRMMDQVFRCASTELSKQAVPRRR